MTPPRTCRRPPEDVAVVIPTRDRWRLLRIALASAVSQENVNVHVLVVDDGSVDASKHELDALSDAGVEVLRHDRPLGVSAARNLGLEHVQAPWVAFLDDDDVWAPGHLTAMLEAARTTQVESRRLGLVYSGHLQVNAQREVLAASPAPTLEAVHHDMDRFNLIGCPSRVLLRTDAARQTGGFDERLSIVADWDLWVRILADYQVVRCPELLVGYMLHAGNMHLDADQFVHELGVMQAKHGWNPRPSRASMRAELMGPGDMLPAFVAAAYRARGRRLQAARWYLRAFRMYGVRRDLARAVGVLLGERFIDMAGLRQPSAVDPSLGTWLEPVRQAERGTMDGLPVLAGVHRGPEAS
jgi:glycosyltransferase involved in cell wall biosynthesis